MILPTFPAFAYQETPTLAKLQSLAGAVSFATQVPIVASLKMSATQAVTASTATAVGWTVEECDSDNMHSTTVNPSRLTAQTQGYYRMHAAIALSIPSATEYEAYFQQTTGSSNPAGSGHTVKFGADASVSGSTTSDYMALSIRSLTPCLYAGDYVEAYVFVGAACTIQYSFGATGNLDKAGFGDGDSCMYAYYAFEGP